MKYAVKAGSLPLLAIAIFCSPKAEADYDPWGLGIDARVAFGQEESRDSTPQYREGDGMLHSLAISLPLTSILNARLSGEQRAISGDRANSMSGFGFNPTYEQTRQLMQAELVLHRPRQLGLHPYLSAGLLREKHEIIAREKQEDIYIGEIVTVRAMGSSDLDGFSLGTGLVWLRNRQAYTLALEQRSLEKNSGEEHIVRLSAAWLLSERVAIGLDLEQRKDGRQEFTDALELRSLGLHAGWRF